MSQALEEFLGGPGERVEWHLGAPAEDRELTRLASMASWITLCWEPSDVVSLTVRSDRLAGRVTFFGALEHRMLESLLTLSRALATGEVDWDTPATPQLLRGLRRGVALDVYVGPRCAFCPAVMEAATRFALANEHVRLRVLRADLGAPDAVRSTPTVLVDGRVAHVGAGAEFPLAEALLAAVGA